MSPVSTDEGPQSTDWANGGTWVEILPSSSVLIYLLSWRIHLLHDTELKGGVLYPSWRLSSQQRKTRTVNVTRNTSVRTAVYGWFYFQSSAGIPREINCTQTFGHNKFSATRTHNLQHEKNCFKQCSSMNHFVTRISWEQYDVCITDTDLFRHWLTSYKNELHNAV
jgi:hypothetical protein